MVSPVSLYISPAEAGEFNKSMAGSPANSIIICAVTLALGGLVQDVSGLQVMLLLLRMLQ